MKIIKQLESIKFRDLCNPFGDLTMTKEDIGKAGIELLEGKLYSLFFVALVLNTENKC